MFQTHFHRTLQCTLEDRHNHMYWGPEFHHSGKSLSHSLECEDRRETTSMYAIAMHSMVLKKFTNNLVEAHSCIGRFRQDVNEQYCSFKLGKG